jgi:hypothetical protein
MNNNLPITSAQVDSFEPEDQMEKFHQMMDFTLATDPQLRAQFIKRAPVSPGEFLWSSLRVIGILMAIGFFLALCVGARDLSSVVMITFIPVIFLGKWLLDVALTALLWAILIGAIYGIYKLIIWLKVLVGGWYTLFIIAFPLSVIIISAFIK